MNPAKIEFYAEYSSRDYLELLRIVFYKIYPVAQLVHVAGFALFVLNLTGERNPLYIGLSVILMLSPWLIIYVVAQLFGSKGKGDLKCFSIDGQGISIVPHTVTGQEWSAVTKIKKTRQGYLLEFMNLDFAYIPKRHFSVNDEITMDQLISDSNIKPNQISTVQVMYLMILLFFFLLGVLKIL